MFNLNDYETVDERVHKFWEQYPNGRIVTDLTEVIRASDGAPLQYVVYVQIWRDTKDTAPAATGYAEEIVGTSQVNKTSALENAETSAIGRALANLGFSTRGARPSQTEMEKVTRVEAVPPSRREVKAPAASTWATEPVKGSDVVIKEPGAAPTEKQRNLLVNRTNALGINSDFYNAFWRFCLAGGSAAGDADITKGEASQLIGMDKSDFEGYAAAFYGSLLEADTKAPF